MKQEKLLGCSIFDLVVKKVNISVHPPKFQWRHAGRFFEHGNKMTGIGKTGHAGNVLHFQVGVDQQKFLRFVDTMHCQIFVHGAGEKASEQPGKVLR